MEEDKSRLSEAEIDAILKEGQVDSRKEYAFLLGL